MARNLIKKKLTSVWFLIVLVNKVSFLQAQEPQLLKLKIEDMFTLADRNSHSIRMYDIVEQEAVQAVKIVRNQMLPSLDVSLSASFLGDGWLADRDFSNGANAPIPHFGNNFAIEASQVIYSGGAITNEVKVAKLRQQSARLEKEKNRQDIRFLLVGNYLELYKLRNQSDVYEKNIEQTKRLLSDIKAKYKEGLALKNDITRHELQLESLELSLTQIKNSKIIINDRLITILGLPQGTVIEVDTCVSKNLPTITSENEWKDIATELSPDLQQARLGVKQSLRGEKIAKSGRLPSVALFAANHLDGPITIEVPPIDKNFNYWYVGIGLKFNIASLYKSGKDIRLAKLSTQKAEENRLLLLENVLTDVKAAHVRYLESFTTYATQMKSLELANQNYGVIRNRYLNDLALITDMLDASNSKLKAELEVANARINIIFNYYRLKKTAGDL